MTSVNSVNDWQFGNGSEEMSKHGLRGVPQHGLRGVPQHGAGGMPLHGAGGVGCGKRLQYVSGAYNGLTFKQKEVLDWLAMKCGTYEKTILVSYRGIGKSFGINKKSVIVRVKALRKKGLIQSAVKYRMGSSQSVGLLVRINKDTFEKYYFNNLIIVKEQDIDDCGREDALHRFYAMLGYAFSPEHGGFVKIEVTPKVAKNDV